MTAVVVTSFGGPEVLRIVQLPTPTPGPDEVLIGVEAVGVGRFLDLAVRAGRHPYPGIRLPHVLGADCAGTVVAHGPGVRAPQVGTRVAVFPGLACGRCARCAEGIEEACSAHQVLGVHRAGADAQFVTVPASAVHPLPAGVDTLDAAAVVLTASVAINQLRAAGFRPGQWVLVQAASSALGATTASVVRQLGGRVIATSRDPGKRRRLRALGVQHVLDSTTASFVDDARRVTGGVGVDITVDNIGSAALWASSLSVLRDGGAIVSSGAFAREPLPLDLATLYSRNLRVVGVRTGRASDVKTVWELMAAGLDPVIDRVFPLAEVGRAHAYLEAGGGVGRVLLSVDQAGRPSNRSEM